MNDISSYNLLTCFDLSYIYNYIACMCCLSVSRSLALLTSQNKKSILINSIFIHRCTASLLLFICFFFSLNLFSFHQILISPSRQRIQRSLFHFFKFYLQLDIFLQLVFVCEYLCVCACLLFVVFILLLYIKSSLTFLYP